MFETGSRRKAGLGFAILGGLRRPIVGLPSLAPCHAVPSQVLTAILPTVALSIVWKNLGTVSQMPGLQEVSVPDLGNWGTQKGHS